MGWLERYSRQILLSQVGEEGQRRLLSSRVAVVGCGGLGSNVAMLLARMGVGYIRCIDPDPVELHNLHRQVLYTEEDVGGAPKSVVAARRLSRVNSDVTVEAVAEKLGPGNAARLLGDVDLVVDGLDNMASRYVLNDVLAELGTPWVHAAVIRTYGRVMPIVPGRTACLRCLQPRPPEREETSAEVGVYPPAVTAVAAVEASEALKILLGHLPSESTLVVIDVWAHDYMVAKVPRRPDCPRHPRASPASRQGSLGEPP